MSCSAKIRCVSRPGVAMREVVVIAMLAFILFMLLLMWLSQTRGDSSRIVCERRQQQTAAAIMQFEAVQNVYPGYKNLQANGADDVPQPTGWVFGLLPYLGDHAPALEEMSAAELRSLADDPQSPRRYATMFEEYGPAGPDSTRGTTPQQRIIELQCPADPAYQPGEDGGLTEDRMSWVVNTGMPDAANFGELPADWTANGMFENQFDAGAADEPPLNAQRLRDADGLAGTLMLSENVDAGMWTDDAEPLVGFAWLANLVDGQPGPGSRLLRINELRGSGDGSPRFARPSAYHVGGVNVVYASGRTQFLSEEIDWLVFTQLMSSDGENAKLPGAESPVPEVYR